MFYLQSKCVSNTAKLALFHAQSKLITSMQYLPVNLEFPMLFIVFYFFVCPPCFFSIPHPLYAKPAPGIFRSSIVYLASCEGETWRTMGIKGLQLAGKVLFWQPWFGNTSQAASYELGRNCSFANLPPSQLLVGWPLQIGAGSFRRQQTFACESFANGEDSCHFVNSDPKTNQLPFLLSNIWNIKKKISLLIQQTLSPFFLLKKKKTHFLKEKNVFVHFSYGGLTAQLKQVVTQLNPSEGSASGRSKYIR